MKRKIAVIVLCAFAVFAAGISLAYYNTRSAGFDEAVRIIEKDDGKIKFRDFEIYYEDIGNFLDKTHSVIPRMISV